MEEEEEQTGPYHPVEEEGNSSGRKKEEEQADPFHPKVEEEEETERRRRASNAVDLSPRGKRRKEEREEQAPDPCHPEPAHAQTGVSSATAAAAGLNTERRSRRAPRGLNVCAKPRSLPVTCGGHVKMKTRSYRTGESMLGVGVVCVCLCGGPLAVSVWR